MHITVKATSPQTVQSKRILAAKYLLVVACCWLLQGCIPLFVAAGAGAGYLAADKKAARKVDRFLQDLLKSSRTSSSRISGARKSGKDEKGVAPSVRLQETSLKPSTVSKGDSVTAVVVYGVVGGAAEEGVTERNSGSTTSVLPSFRTNQYPGKTAFGKVAWFLRCRNQRAKGPMS